MPAVININRQAIRNMLAAGGLRYTIDDHDRIYFDYDFCVKAPAGTFNSMEN